MEQLEVRRPHLAALRLHEVLLWLVAGSGLAWLLAPSFIGVSPGPKSDASYVAIWAVLSLAVALVWVYRQWQARASLPPQQHLAFSWSAPVCAVIMAVIFSVVPIAELAAERHVRSLRSKAELSLDLARLQSCRKATVRRTFSLTPRGLLQCRARPQLDRVDFPDEAWLLPEHLREKSDCVVDDDLVRRYVEGHEADRLHACVQARLDDASDLDACRSAAEVPMQPLWNECGRQILAACDTEPARLQFFSTVYYLSLLYEIDINRNPSSAADLLLQLSFLCVLLGALASWAAVFRTRIVLTTLAVFAISSLVVPRTLTVFLQASSWRAGAWSIAAVLTAATLLYLRKRRARDERVDYTVLTLHIAPLFFLLVEAYLDPKALSLCIDPAQDEQAWPGRYVYPALALGWTLLTGTVLRWYRQLPRAT